MPDFEAVVSGFSRGKPGLPVMAGHSRSKNVAWLAYAPAIQRL